MRSRQRTQCTVREAAKGLDAPIEWSLCFWKGYPIDGEGANEPDDLAAAWLVHKDKVLPHFTQQCPGMRPFAMWALGLIELPKVIAKPYISDTPFKTKVGPVYEERCYGGYFGLYKQLLKLDLIDAGEQQAADKFFSDKPERAPYNEYKLLSEASFV